MTTVIDLPFPISVNQAYANVRGKGRVPTKRHKVWKNAAGTELISQRPRAVPGPIAVHLVYEDKGGNRDLDNLAKVCLDLLVEHRIIEDDSCRYVREITMGWSRKIKGCRVTIKSETEIAA